VTLDLWSRFRQKIAPGFRFSKPLVLLQSDDWGRVGVRDEPGREELRAAGFNLGERPYDLYSLETADDVQELASVLAGLKDSAGRPACLEMNFVTANVDFAASASREFREIILKPLADGLPGRWARPGLHEAYREGIQQGLFCPALHGTTHFCQSAATRALAHDGEAGSMLRTLWKAETPYIHWRMPWMGFEYWDPGQAPAHRFISSEEQKHWIVLAAQGYRKMFGESAISACAPGYRAHATTHRCWKEEGIGIAQNGPGTMRGPHYDAEGLFHTYRTLDFEPALHPELQWEDCVRDASQWLDRGIPCIVSIHSINFHSTLVPNRQKTLPLLRNLLTALKKKYPDLLYVNSRQLLQIVVTGSYQSEGARIPVGVTGFRRGKRA
jgi:hypothetical protein